MNYSIQVDWSQDMDKTVHIYIRVCLCVCVRETTYLIYLNYDL